MPHNEDVESTREGSALDEAAERRESPASAAEEASQLQDRFTTIGESSGDDDGDGGDSDGDGSTDPRDLFPGDTAADFGGGGGSDGDVPPPDPAPKPDPSPPDGVDDGTGDGGGTPPPAPDPEPKPEDPKPAPPDEPPADEIEQSPDEPKLNLEDLPSRVQSDIRRQLLDEPQVERGILDFEDFAVEEFDEDDGTANIVLGESGRRKLAARAIRRKGDVSRFDPDRDLVEVAPGAFEASVGVDGGEQIRGVAFSESALQTLEEQSLSRAEAVAEESFERQTGLDVEPGQDFRTELRDGRFVSIPTEQFQDRLQSRAEKTAKVSFEDFKRFQADRRAAGEAAFQRDEFTFGDFKRLQAERQSAGESVFEFESATDSQLDQLPEDQVTKQRGSVESIEDAEELDKAEEAFEQRLEAEFGVSFEAGEDFRAVETEDGTFNAEFTSSGATKAGTAPLTNLVGDVEQRLGIDGPLGIDIPQFERDRVRGPRAGPQRRVGTERAELDGFELGPIASGIGEERDLGNFGGEAGEDFEELLAEVQTEITERTAATTVPDLEAERPNIPGPRQAPRPRVSRAEATTGQEFTVSAAESVLRTPSFLVGGVELAKDAADLNVKLSEEAAEGDIEGIQQTFEDVGQVTVNKAAIAASTAIDKPVKTGGAAVGSLIGTGFLFAGARVVGPKTSLGTRALIQPGEEIAGIGGFRATKAIAGKRRAQQLFPNKEPLIFSEEAAIRNAARAKRRTGSALAAARERIDRVEGVDVQPRMGALGGSIPKIKIRTESESESSLLDEIQDALFEVERADFRRRQEAKQEQKLAEQALRTEEREGFTAEPTAGKDFTPSRAGGPRGRSRSQARAQRARLTSGALERRRRAQTPTVETETESVEGEVEEFSTDPEVRQEVEQLSLAEQKQLDRVETTVLEEERLTEATVMELEEAIESDLDTETLLELRPDQVVETGVGAEVATLPATELRQALELETELERRLSLETEFESEFESELEREIETETETELELETETETEVETEVELEQETEQEIEVEVDLPGDKEPSPFDLGDNDDLDVFSRTFEASVATPKEILGSDIDAVDADVDADVASVDDDLSEVFDDDAL